MDSDKGNEADQLSDSKKRLINELENLGGVVWITYGRDIENYLTGQIVSDMLKCDVDKDPGRYEEFSDYLNKLKSGVGNTFENDKVRFSKRAAMHIKDDCLDRFDLKARIDECVIEIESWNSIPDEI